MIQIGDVTLSAAVTWFLAACAGLVSVAKAWDIIKRVLSKSDISKQIRDVERKVEQDSKRVDALENGQRITMRALLALINHEIDGNNIEGMKTMRTEISNYLIER